MQQFPSALPNDGDELEKLIQEHEQSLAPLKEDNEAKIIWNDEGEKEKTEYSIVYLHGFGASRGEGDPWHRAVAQKFCCNLYLARLHNHGLKRKRFFEGFRYKKLLDSAIEACRIGQKIGEKVLVTGTSTGASLALCAAGSGQCPVPIKGLLLVSPLIHFYGYQSLFLENKTGRTLAEIILGSNYKQPLFPNNFPASPVGRQKKSSEAEIISAEKNIWYPYVPLRAALELGRMVEKEITPSLFKKVKCPVFVGYYNKNARLHDRIVSPHAIESMFNQFGTPPAKLQLVNFPEAKSHVIGNGLLSNAVPELIVRSVLFLRGKVGIK